MELELGIVRWLLEVASLPDDIGNLTTMGSGPLAEGDFDSMLRDTEIEVFEPGESTTILVSGREGWNSQAINALLDARSGRTLRAYSQEMFIAYLVSGEDPLANPTVARHLAGNHPALMFLEAVGFNWPTTQVGNRGQGGVATDLLPESFLMHLGYKVRAGGPDTRKRYQILSEAYERAQVPNVFPAGYVADWGAPETPTRLKKIADTIAYTCTLQKAQRRAPSQAIEKWESDLRWLKAKFYRGRHTFRWPSTEIG